MWGKHLVWCLLRCAWTRRLANDYLWELHTLRIILHLAHLLGHNYIWWDLVGDGLWLNVKRGIWDLDLVVGIEARWLAVRWDYDAFVFTLGVLEGVAQLYIMIDSNYDRFVNFFTASASVGLISILSLSPLGFPDFFSHDRLCVVDVGRL